MEAVMAFPAGLSVSVASRAVDGSGGGGPSTPVANGSAGCRSAALTEQQHSPAAAAAVGQHAAAAASSPSAVLSPVSPSTLQIMSLYTQLVAAFQHEKAILGFPINNTQPKDSFRRLDSAVQAMLSQYALAASDWRAYAHFNDLHYVRNLVDTNEDFEMMVICWRRGQASRVHNHGRSHCWLAVLEGQVAEAQFYDPEGLGVHSPKAHDTSAPNIPGVITSVSPCPDLEALSKAELQRGQVSYISDMTALHAVRCSEREFVGEGAVTLHIYAPPIRRVTLYEPELNRVVERIPGFFTVKGRRTVSP